MRHLKAGRVWIVFQTAHWQPTADPILVMTAVRTMIIGPVHVVLSALTCLSLAACGSPNSGLGEPGPSSGGSTGSGVAGGLGAGSATGGSSGTGFGGSAGLGSAGVSGSETGGSASAGSGGAEPSLGGGGASAGRGGAGAGGGPAGGTGGTTNGGSGGASADADTPPPRPLNVSAARARHEHTFRNKDADASVTFNDNTQIAVVDNRAATMMGKLVLPFQGQGTTAGTMGAGGDFCAHRGFHVLAIAAFQNYNIVIGDAAFYGDARKEVFEGVEYTHTGDFAKVQMTPADGVAQRTQKALQYLDKLYPGEGWGYYLNADGSVRWSDVIFEGMSRGASNAARFGMLVRAARVVSISGPRDNACTSLTAGNCGGVVAKWLYETPKTPSDRFYALTGVSDDQHLQHLFAMQTMKYVGAAVNVVGAQAPYGGSHRLVASGGHSDYCSQASYKATCNYLFGVPTENANGTP